MRLDCPAYGFTTLDTWASVAAANGVDTVTIAKRMSAYASQPFGFVPTGL